LPPRHGLRALFLALSPLALVLLAMPPAVGAHEGDDGDEDLGAWRAAREAKLRGENGWLALVGRFPLAPGPNTIGTAADSDVVFPAVLRGTGPERLGTVTVEPLTGTVTLHPADNARFVGAEGAIAGARPLDVDGPDWVGIGRFRFQVIARHGAHFLRLADNESPSRSDFPGCSWYPPDERYRVTATFVGHKPGDTLRLVDVSGRAVERPCPGHAEFVLGGRRLRLDAVGEETGLFFVFRDATAADTTYPGGRFIDVAGIPADGATFVLDFNRAYNPPCAVSAFTTCPTPPSQNVLAPRVEAGERYPPAGQGGGGR